MSSACAEVVVVVALALLVGGCDREKRDLEKPRLAPRLPFPGAQMISPRKAPRPKIRSHATLTSCTAR